MTDLHHIRAGTGPPLALFAGIGMSGRAWLPVLDRLTPEREVWLVDLPGFGGSRPLPAGTRCDAAALAGAVDAFFARAGLERPHVAGNSLGGAVALELGARGSAASVTALSPAGFASRPEQEWATASLRATYALAGRLRPHAPVLLRRPGLRRVLCGQMFARPEAMTPAQAFGHLETLRDGPGFQPTLAALAEYRFAGRVDVPVTIAWGTRDALLLPTQARRARRVLPGARSVRLPGLGHVPMSDDPAAVARVLLEGSRAQNAVLSANG